MRDFVYRGDDVDDEYGPLTTFEEFQELMEGKDLEDILEILLKNTKGDWGEEDLATIRKELPEETNNFTQTAYYQEKIHEIKNFKKDKQIMESFSHFETLQKAVRKRDQEKRLERIRDLSAAWTTLSTVQQTLQEFVSNPDQQTLQEFVSDPKIGKQLKTMDDNLEKFREAWRTLSLDSHNP